MSLLTTNRHADGSEWIHSKAGTDAKGQRWMWICINADGSRDEYLCNRHGWIPADSPPKVLGTLAIVFDSEYGYQDADQWAACDSGEFTWMESMEVTHWKPQSENPQ